MPFHVWYVIKNTEGMCILYARKYLLTVVFEEYFICDIAHVDIPVAMFRVGCDYSRNHQ